MRPPQSASKQSGYTLIEVVVAFAILVGSLGILLESFATVTTRNAKAAQLQEAVLLAASVRDRLGSDIPLSLGTVDRQEGDCHWSVAAQARPRPTLDRPPQLIAYDTTIKVACGDATAAQQVLLHSVELVTAS